MIQADDFLTICKQNQFNLFSGTPCSYLKPLINAVIDDADIDYLAATNEGDAVAMVCGASLARRKGVVMFQNSGLGNAINVITSLSYPFRIPFLLIVTHRGQPGGQPDEPQHELMGQVTEEMLTVLRIKWEHFPDDPQQLEEAFSRAVQYMGEANLPYAFIMRKGTVAARALKTGKLENPIGKRELNFSENLSKKYSERVSRTVALQKILEFKQKSDILIATTGKTGRELYTLDDAPEHFYMVGSMGCASSFALGAALSLEQYRWVVIDGDAATLMRMGNLASIGSFLPKNFLHIVLDNEVNDSTGGQSTISSDVSLAAVALACGYRQAYSTDDLNALEPMLSKISPDNGPVFIHFRIKQGSPQDLGRPKIKPFEVKQRLMRHIGGQLQNS